MLGLFGNSQAKVEALSAEIDEFFEILRGYKVDVPDAVWEQKRSLVASGDVRMLRGWWKSDRAIVSLRDDLSAAKQREAAENERRRQARELEAMVKRCRAWADEKLGILCDDAGVIEHPCEGDVDKQSYGKWVDTIKLEFGLETEHNAMGRAMNARGTAGMAGAILGSAVEGYRNSQILGQVSDIYSGMRAAKLVRPVASMDRAERQLACAYVEAYGLGLFKEESAENIWKGFAWAGGNCHIQIDQDKGRSEIKRMIERLYTEGFVATPDVYVAALKQNVQNALEHADDKDRDHIQRHTNFGSRWLNADDIRHSRFGLNQPNGLILGGMDNDLVTYSGVPSVLWVAPPGSGKTQTLIPSLLTYNGSAVVLDIKGELFEKTAGARAAMGQAIFRWNAFDSSGTHRYNPLRTIRRHPDEIWEDCQEMARSLLPDVAEERDPFWRSEARNLVTMHLALDAARRRRRRGG